MVDLVEVSISLDEIEAIRLADYERRYHKDAAKTMNISRQTFGRILKDARRKVSECLIVGKALRIDTNKEERR